MYDWHRSTLGQKTNTILISMRCSSDLMLIRLSIISSLQAPVALTAMPPLHVCHFIMKAAVTPILRKRLSKSRKRPLSKSRVEV